VILGGFIGQNIMNKIKNEYYLKIFIAAVLILITSLMICKKLGLLYA